MAYMVLCCDGLPCPTGKELYAGLFEDEEDAWEAAQKAKANGYVTKVKCYIGSISVRLNVRLLGRTKP